MTRDELIEAMATSEAAYDGRTFAGLSAPEKARYRDRCKANLSAIEASGHAIVPVEPEEEMIQAGIKQSASYPVCPPGMTIPPIHQFTLRLCWLAMIAAGKI